jgi:serine O-acetyltransferase
VSARDQPGDPAEVAAAAVPAGGPSLAEVVAALCTAPPPAPRGRYLLPSTSQLARVVESLRVAIFPSTFTPWDLAPDALRHVVGAAVDRAAHELEEQVRRALGLVEGDANGRLEERARRVTRAFLGRLPEVQRRLRTDVLAAYRGDPAARSTDEVLLSYPGLVAITSQRLAHELYRLDVPLLPRMITEEAHGRTGIDIHPGAAIGEEFFIDHGTGVVIGETCVVGRGVRLYQGVTLGARSFPLDAEGNPVKGVPRHPIVEDDVVIYSGATVLGRVTIGRGSTIGGNVWLTRSVPPGSVVTQGNPREGFESGGGI